MNDFEQYESLVAAKTKWRKKKERKINYTPTLTIREPIDGVREESIVILGHDELETLRLKNINKLGIVKAAQQMWISKSLFANIYKEAVDKVTSALIHGKSLHIELGRPEYAATYEFGFRHLS